MAEFSWRRLPLAHASVHPLELSDYKPEPSERLLLAASAIVMDDLDQFPDYRLDTLHFDRTIATARLQSENIQGCTVTPKRRSGRIASGREGWADGETLDQASTLAPRSI
jgi:hypothetical protein